MEDPIERMKRQAENLLPVPQPMPVPLPNIPVDRPPSSPADAERWAILSQARTIIENALQDAGYRLIGSGFGMRSNSYGEADIGLEYAGHKVEVRAYVPKDEQDSMP